MGEGERERAVGERRPLRRACGAVVQGKVEGEERGAGAGVPGVRERTRSS